jgi:hypothetical protein
MSTLSEYSVSVRLIRHRLNIHSVPALSVGLAGHWTEYSLSVPIG